MHVQAANTVQNKLKVQLKLSISRLRMTQQKDSAKAKQQRREMAQLLEVGDQLCARFHMASRATVPSSRQLTAPSGWQSPISADTRREHHSLRHHHRIA
jgi:hypothetical protein